MSLIYPRFCSVPYLPHLTIDGSKLFDVKSDYRVKKCVKEAYCFDNTFYEDQKMERKLRMMLIKVRKEFVQAEVSHMKREATAQSCRVSAFADFSTANFQEGEETIEHEPITEEDLDFSAFSEPDLNSTTYTQLAAVSTVLSKLKNQTKLFKQIKLLMVMSLCMLRTPEVNMGH